MTTRVINDPSAVGWEFDPATGRWLWAGSSGGGGGGGNDPRIADQDIVNWNASFSWGNHADAGYLTDFTETDPTVPDHVKAITPTDIANWNAGTGGGGGAGPDPRITDTQITNWDTAYGWGDHSTAGYLTSFTETDPVFAASVAAGITQTDINNWNAGTGGGGGFSGDYNDLTNKPTIPTNNNQLTNGAGYVTATVVNGYARESWVSQNYQAKGSYLTSETDPVFAASPAGSITQAMINSWNAAGSPATPTLQQVTDAGATTNKSPSAPNWFTQSDGYTLGGTVSGGARIIISNGLTYSNTSNVGVLTVANNGTVTASGDVTAFSDARLKENVETLDGSKVYEMRGVSFLKDGCEGSGVIAQELQKVAPELVHDEGEYLSVSYGNLVGYLIEAVKELKAEVEELKRDGR